MSVLILPKVTPQTNYMQYQDDETTGFSSDDDFCDDYAPGPPTSTRKWELCK